MSDLPHGGFPHERLKVYGLSQELVEGVAEITAGFKPGFAHLRDQLNRSALSTARNISEGANRVYARDKRARFSVARGECGETDASLESAVRMKLADPDRVKELRVLTDRIGAMLLGLIRRETRNDRDGPAGNFQVP